MIKILFVCYANQSRSPLAKGLFKKLINDAGVEDSFLVESRGIWVEKKNSETDPEIIKRLKFLNAPYDGMVAQKIKQQDYRDFDFIICMDEKNESYLKKHAGIYRDKVYLVRDIKQETKRQNILDPFETLEYDDMTQMLYESLVEWLEMFKISKLSKAIDVEDYRISNKPVFLFNPNWYIWNPEIQRYELTKSASNEAISSHKAFYEEE
ncbi:MAG: hypothetical protein K9L02_01825 [Acholeplasmataceae bacterium]|nr:hypothetical protein [Acholeplasmataceae bacterium]